MTSYVTPKINTEYIFYAGLQSQADTKLLQANPTLAAGDVKVSIDGGAFANLTTLPVVTPAAGKSVKVTLSADEMNGDNITVLFSDAAGAEWCDLMMGIQTTANQVDDLALANGIQTAVNAALVALHLDHLLAVDYDPASKPGVATALLNELIGDDGGVSQFTTNALELVGAIVWGYAQRALTQAAASVKDAVDGSNITVYRGTTWIIPLTDLGNIATYDKIYFSAKASVNESEDNALVRVYNNASGLQRFNGAAPMAATNGTITIDDATAGNITITIQEEETVNAPLVSGYRYDVKGIDSGGDVVELSANGLFTVAGDVTLAIT